MRRAVHLLFISHTFRFTKQLAKQQITIVVFAVLWVETRLWGGGAREGDGEPLMTRYLQQGPPRELTDIVLV